MNKPTVTYFQRKPYTGHWSIEAIFVTLRKLLADKIQARTKIASFVSRGVFKRIAIAAEAFFYQADVNHITGDIHYVAAFLKPSKTILTVNDCGILRESQSVLKHKIFLHFWYRMPVRRARFVVVISAFTQQELQHYLPDLPVHKIRIIPPFISEAFTYQPGDFNKTCPALLHIGLAENKNLNRLVEAIENIPCSLTIVGKLSPQQEAHLVQHNISYRSVSNLSEEQMVSEFVRCDVLTFVSTFEGFGMPIIEANRVGRAVLTSNVASMPDVAGEAACLIDPFDVQSIRNGLLKIINDDDYRNGLIKKGLQNARRFDNEVIARQYYELYCEIAGSK